MTKSERRNGQPLTPSFSVFGLRNCFVIQFAYPNLVHDPNRTASKSWEIPDTVGPTSGLQRLTGTDSPRANLERVARRHGRRFDRTQSNNNLGAPQNENEQLDAISPC